MTANLPKTGDFLSCFYPSHEDRKSAPGPKNRSVLVGNVLKDGSGKIWLNVAYCTGQMDRQRTTDVSVTLPQACKAAGSVDLRTGEPVPFKIDLTRTRLLPYTSAYFPDMNNPAGPRRGRLDKRHSALVAQTAKRVIDQRLGATVWTQRLLSGLVKEFG